MGIVGEPLDSLAEYSSLSADTILPKVTSGKKYDAKEVYVKHEEIIRLTHLGHSQRDIQRMTGIPSSTISTCLRSDIIQDRLADLSNGADDDVRTISGRIADLQAPALDYLESVMDGEQGANVNLRAKTAMDLMEMGGNGKVTKVEGKHLHGVVGEGGLERIQQRAFELAQESDNLVEVSKSTEE